MSGRARIFTIAESHYEIDISLSPVQYRIDGNIVSGEVFDRSINAENAVSLDSIACSFMSGGPLCEAMININAHINRLSEDEP